MTQRIFIVLNGLVMTKRKKIEPKHCLYSKSISEGEQIEPDATKNLQYKNIHTPIKLITEILLSVYAYTVISQANFHDASKNYSAKKTPIKLITCFSLFKHRFHKPK